MSLEVQTTCPYCGVGCGVIASIDDAGSVTVKGDPAHPSNFSRLCSKGAALADTIGMDGRVLYPEVDAMEYSWEHALGYTARKFNSIIEEHGPDSVAFYISGQLLSEDYYVANKLMKGFIGSANIDTNSRLCMSSAVAGYKRAFGSDTVPCSYEDLERAKLIVLTGSNTAWCHPVLYQRIVQAKKTNPDLMVVVIDPRKTATCDIADMHLAIQSGTDHILFKGLLSYLDSNDETNNLFVSQFTQGYEACIEDAKLSAASVESVAALCGLPVKQVENFYKLFSRTERVVTVYSQGINQWSYGTDNANAIINCHLITGRIGRPGMGPFSITGQPNAMGGREVGGLANQLAAHMAIDNKSHRDLVQSFWESPVIADTEGLKAIDLFQAINAGKIKAVWIMATNPAVSMPDANAVREALQKCEFVVVSDCIRNTDTTRYANVLFPAQTWGERDGSVTSSERRISRQRAFLPTPGQARPDWWIISKVAQHMGYSDAFDYERPFEIFREHAALSGFKNTGERDFDISAYADLNEVSYDAMRPLQWPITKDSPHGTKRMFSDGRFFTPSGKAQFVMFENHQPVATISDAYPFVLNTGRVRDQWHTMTRTGKSARLSGHRQESFVAMHPDDAKHYGIAKNSLVMVTSERGQLLIRANLSDTQQQGTVFIPIHWNDQFSSNSVVGKLIAAETDPISGQPEFKHTAVKVEVYNPAWYGFILSRRKLTINHASYWSVSKGRDLWRYEIAGDEAAGDWANCARQLLCKNAKNVEWVEYFDSAQGRYRGARIENGHLESCIFIGPDQNLPERDWLAQLLAQESLEADERISLLTGKPASGQHDVGAIVCSCFSVGINTLSEAIRTQNLTNVESIGTALRAGTNCGSCIPELKKIIQETIPSL